MSCGSLLSCGLYMAMPTLFTALTDPDKKAEFAGDDSIVQRQCGSDNDVLNGIVSLLFFNR